MRINLLLTFALAAALGASAISPQSRVGSPTHGAVKQITDKQFVKQRNVPNQRKALGEAPANAVEVPFTHGLGKDGFEGIKDKYTAINANNDGRTWKYGAVNGYAACMQPNDDGIDKNDDWLITVPVHMTPGDYVLSFEVGMMGSGAVAVEFDAWLFSVPNLDGKLAEIAPTTRHTVKDFTTYEFNCAIPEEGYYYFGVHCTTSKADKGTMKLAKLGVREGSVTPPVVVDPPAAGTLTYELAPKGELKATVTYVAPTKTKSGADLEEISKVVLTSRWEVDKFVFENVAPGQTITQEVEMYAGINNRFTAVAYVGENAGDKVEIKSIWCGPDTPLAPTDVKLTVSDDYTKATLSWTAPGEVGENGGYVDTENLVYYIFDAFGSYYDPALGSTDKTYYEFDYSDIEGQDFFAYQVTAGYGDYYSLDNSSNVIVAGAPSQLPFIESFTNGYYDGVWMLSPETTSGNTMNYGTITDDYFASLFDPEDPDAPEPLTSQDGDNGFYYWLPYDNTAVLGLISLRADISKAANPVLEFWYQGQGSVIDVYVAGGADELALAKSFDMKENPTSGWTLARVPLSDYKAKGSARFEIRLRAIHNDEDHVWSVPFDNISIRDLVPVDLHVVSSTIPAKVKPAQAIACSAYVENFGYEAAAATASLMVNGAVVATKEIGSIPANGFAGVEFEYTIPLNAPESFELAIKVDADGEATPADNVAAAKVEVNRANYATVNDLTANVTDSQVTLSWSAPVNEQSGPEVVSEDFENEEYTPMSISGAGGWTVYDGDGQKTYNVFRELYNPYQTQPIGFQLFNREVAQVPDQYWIDAEPHSGNTMMMAPSAQSALNDNWLISPELSGEKQTVTFWAKSYTIAWPETMEVYYSTTDNKVESFTATATVSGEFQNGVVPEVWTLFTVELPAGAKYFAIHHDTYDTLALFVDDVTYEGLPSIPEDLAVVGYHVFRDGKQITDEPVKETTYVDAPVAADAADGNYHFDYSVVPVYNYGPAAESNVAGVDIQYSGIIDVAIDSLDADAAVYTLQGIRVSRETVTPGVYIVVSGSAAAKVRLR